MDACLDLECRSRMETFRVWETGPIDHWEGFTSIEEWSDSIEYYLKNNPRYGLTFDDMWFHVLQKLYWAWTKCDFIDLTLRSPHVYIYPNWGCKSFSIAFKADNNGTVYLITDNHLDDEMLPYHEFGDDWKLIESEK